MPPAPSRSHRRHRLLVTCEHGGCRVPARYAPILAAHRASLTTHRGWDPGTMPLARTLARRLAAPIVASDLSRLLVDLNRSPQNPAAFAAATRRLPADVKAAIRQRYHEPHWRRVRQQIDALMVGGAAVLHVGVHSFTPVLAGRTRRADVALLYDPSRPREKALAHVWRQALRRRADLRVRMNYPYQGKSDGLTTALRRALPASRYLGIELEVNQKLIQPTGRFAPALTAALVQSLAEAIALGLTPPPRPAASTAARSTRR